MLPPFGSNVPDLASDPTRLRSYAEKVINGRIVLLLLLSYTKTWFFLDIYLDGLTKKNPFALVFSTRAQIEVLALVSDALSIVRHNAGHHPKNFARRAQEVDEALITAFYGTRDERVINLVEQYGASKLRPARGRDFEVLNARNIMTRIEKLAKNGEYESLIADYYRLCDYLHPNFGQNVILIRPSAKNPKLMTVSRTDPGIMETALDRTLGPMTLAARSTVRI